MDDIIRRISNEEFSSWLKVSIGLTITAEGLSDYVKYLTVTIYRDLVSKLGHLKVCTENCSRNEPNIGRWCKTCQAWLDGIMKYNKQNERNIKWTVMDSSKWPTDSEEMGHVFTCFKWNQDGGRTKLKDDISKMLSFLINCKKTTLNRQVLFDAKEVRNKLAHSSNHYLSEAEALDCLHRLANLSNSHEISSTVSGNLASVRLSHLKNIDFLKLLSEKNVSVDPIIQDLKARLREVISEIVIEDRRQFLPNISNRVLLLLLSFVNILAICLFIYGNIYQQANEISTRGTVSFPRNITNFMQDEDLCDENQIPNVIKSNGNANKLGTITNSGAQLDPIQITRVLDRAIDHGHLSMVICLHNKGGVYSNFSLLIAVKSNTASKHMVEFICKTGIWTAEQKKDALHETCFRGNLDIAKYLVQNGAKYNKFTLLTAISGPDDNHYMVEFILKSGNWSESQKTEGIDAAIFRGKLNTVLLLNKMKTSFSDFSLLTAASSRFDDKHLVEFISVSKNWSKEQKMEALDAACYRGKLNTVIYLHQNGAKYSRFSLLTSVKSPGDNTDLIEFVFKSGSWTKEQVVEATTHAQYLKKIKTVRFLILISKQVLSFEKATDISNPFNLYDV